MKVFIDGDSIAYKAGYAKHWYLGQRAIDNVMSRILDACGTDDYEIYIEEWKKKKTNFRTKMAVVKYKERAPSKCPFLIDAKEYLVNNWNAKIVNGRESEDMCIIRAYEHGKEDSIVACIDGDLLCHPLTFYNYDERNQLGKGLGISIKAGKMKTLTEEEATLHLWRQVLTGDKVDSIPGVKGIGKVTAQRLITDPNTAMETAAYTYKQKGLGYRDFIATFNLIYIRSTMETKVLRPLSKTQFNNMEKPYGKKTP